MENESPMPERPAGPVYGDLWHPEERNWSMLVHLSALSSFLTSGAGGILGPLVVWLIFRGKSDMVNYHGKKALNFQISFLIYFIILFIAMIPLFIVGSIAGEKDEIAAGFWAPLILLIIAMIALGIVSLVWTIVAAVRASRGDPPGYILAIPFLR